MGGFARTGLNPFDRDVMWHRFTLNAGKFLSTSRADEMRAAASSVISQAQENTNECQRPSRQIQTGTVATPNDAVFGPEALLKASAEREAAARAQKAEEQATKLTKTCRAPECLKTPRGGPGWLCCECKHVRLCPSHHDSEEATLQLAICECQSIHLVSEKRRTPVEPNPPLSSSAIPLTLRPPACLIGCPQN